MLNVIAIVGTPPAIVVVILATATSLLAPTLAALLAVAAITARTIAAARTATCAWTTLSLSMLPRPPTQTLTIPASSS